MIQRPRALARYDFVELAPRPDGHGVGSVFHLAHIVPTERLGEQFVHAVAAVQYPRFPGREVIPSWFPVSLLPQVLEQGQITRPFLDGL